MRVRGPNSTVCSSISIQPSPARLTYSSCCPLATSLCRCAEAFGGSSKIWQPNAVMPRSVRASEAAKQPRMSLDDLGRPRQVSEFAPVAL
jgi:hypothetical protein